MKWWGSNNPLGGGVNFAYRQKFGQHDLVLGGAYDASSGYLDSSDGHAVRGTVKYRYRVKSVPGLNFGLNFSGYNSWGKTFFFWNGLDSNAYKPYPNTITVYKTYRFTVDPFIDYYDNKNNHITFLGRFFNATNTNNTGQGSAPNQYYGELRYHRKFDFKKFDFNLVTGVVNQYNDVNPPEGATNSLFGKNTLYNFSAFAQTDFKFFKKLNISLGARWEYFNMRHYEKDSTGPGEYFQRFDTAQNSLKQLPYPLFRIGVNYQAAEATYIRASFGQGFRYPTIAERYISTNVGVLAIASNPYLEPEKGYSAEIGIKQGFKVKEAFTGFADASFFWNQYDNMMEFTFGQFGSSADFLNPDKLFGYGFSSQNIGRARILGTEITFGGEAKIGKDWSLQFLTGYTFIDPRALNWDDSLVIYNREGIQLLNQGNSANAYNQANRPDTTSNQLTYGLTSESSTNLLKYRSRHTFKFDLTVRYKGLEWNSNLQYSSFQENVDYAFTSFLFSTFADGGGTFSGLKQYRADKRNTPIGRGRGDIVWNMHVAYNFDPGVRVAFIVKNLLNWEYTPRPAYFESPRNYTLQLSYTFGGGARKSSKVAVPN
jgi:outer membrane receptor protein involved in Fe transport